MRRTSILLCAVMTTLVVTGLRVRTDAQTDAAVIDVRDDRPGAEIPHTLFGVFYEDINFAGDGGLYPEQVKNRSFEFPDPLMGWNKAVPSGGRHEARAEGGPSERNPAYLRIEVAGGEPYGVMNDGFRGVAVREGEPYTVSLLARVASGSPRAVRLEVQTRGRTLGSARLEGFTGQWARYSATLTPTASLPTAWLSVLVEGQGALDIDAVSLYPVNTFKKRPNGVRADLAQLLADLRPGFLRFPGGCIVEGRYLDTRYEWKETIGDRDERKVIINRWNDEFMHRPAADYFQSFGLGFYEYFVLSEDIGAEPLPILNCGMACQYNSGELTPLDQLDPFIQDALDLIEFANGAPTTTWGRRRAEMGHPAPFNLKYLGVGNEQWGPEYVKRYERFHKVLKAKHPEIRLIAAADPAITSKNFDEQWAALRAIGADLVDEHFYRPPSWFLEQAARYDTYPRGGTRVFAGEFAAHVPTPGVFQSRNVWEAALAEAAFMTGLERNADVVEMAAYAPLFGHVNAWQWSPNLIWFDNLRAYGTPSYYVQQLYGQHRGTRVVPVSRGGSPVTGQDGVFASASLDQRSGELIVKLVNVQPAPRSVRLALAGGARKSGRALLMTADLAAENSLQEPRKVVPVEEPIAAAGPHFERTLPAHSVTVLRLAR